jgi:hypothetical protein
MHEPTDIRSNEQDLTQGWLELFRAYEEHGGPFATQKSMFNLWGYFFGPLYWMLLGLWRKTLTLMAGLLCSIFLLAFLEAPEGAFRVLGILVQVLDAMLVNYAFFLLRRRNSRSWNPFEGFWPS